MNIIDIPCNKINYGGLRAGPVKYIVVHYTAGVNDRARSNGQYFGREDTGKTSAHFFVDETEIVRSVPEDHVAYHCGGSSYYHPECRNGNSIGVEICTRFENRQYTFSPQAVARAQMLIRGLMEKYDIPTDRVLRHWDVTHKICPAPFVGENKGAWEAFQKGLDDMAEQRFADVPKDAWYAEAVEYCAENGLMNGISNDQFAPDAPVTRAQMATILMRLEKR